MSAPGQPRHVVATRPIARRRRRRRALTALGITSALVIGVGYGTWQYIEQNEFLLDERCEVTVAQEEHQLSPNQAHNAALLSASAVDRELPPQAAVHAVAISLQESELQVREAPDERDARVLFARGTPDWNGDTDADPVETSIAGFYDVLEESWRAGFQDGDDDDAEEESDPEDAEPAWGPEMPLDEAAEVLDRPHNPQFYPQHGSVARAFAGPLTGQQPVGMTCHLSQLDVPGPDPEGVVDELVAVLPNALEIPFTEAPEDEQDQNGDDDDGEEEFVPEPILDDVIEVSGEGEEAVVTVQVPEHENYDQQWMLAHWAVAVARDYGIQAVASAPYEWNRDSARWERLPEDSEHGEGTVTITFSRDG